MNSLRNIRIFLGLVPKESHCISPYMFRHPLRMAPGCRNMWEVTVVVVLCACVILIHLTVSVHNIATPTHQHKSIKLSQTCHKILLTSEIEKMMMIIIIRYSYRQGADYRIIIITLLRNDEVLICDLEFLYKYDYFVRR